LVERVGEDEVGEDFEMRSIVCVVLRETVSLPATGTVIFERLLEALFALQTGEDRQGGG
jgi:hypothetical protein